LQRDEANAAAHTDKCQTGDDRTHDGATSKRESRALGWHCNLEARRRPVLRRGCGAARMSIR